MFGPSRTAVFVDGCFWHGCPDHGTLPKANRDWWREKLDANVVRDRVATAALSEHGWTVVRVWEHEPLEQAADRIEKCVRPDRRDVMNDEERPK